MSFGRLVATQLYVRHHLPAQYPERGFLRVAQLARLAIKDAHRSEQMSVTRRAGLEAMFGLPVTSVLREMGVLCRIRHFEHLLQHDCVRAERLCARCFRPRNREGLAKLKEWRSYVTPPALHRPQLGGTRTQGQPTRFAGA